MFFHIYDHLWIPCLADIFHSSYLSSYLETECTCVSIQITNADDVLS